MARIRRILVLGVLCIGSAPFHGCSSNSSSNISPDKIGTHYFAVVAPPPNTILSQVGAKVAVTDSTGHDEWCAPHGVSPQTLVQQACAQHKFDPSVTMCSQVSALVANDSTNLNIWGSDLAKNINYCQQGTILGPGTTEFNPKSNAYDTMYTCLYTNDPPQPCDPTAQAQNPDPPGAAGFPNYLAMARSDSGPGATVVSDEDSSKNGTLNLASGTRAFSFDLDASTMYIVSLNLPVQSFTFNGQWFTSALATLVSSTQGALQGNSTYTISPSNAKFSMIALDQNGAGYTFTATNSTQLAIDIGSGAGPHISGTIKGSLEGHSLHADLDVSMVWLNRPPVTAIKASNVTFNSSGWPGARDVSTVCMTQNGLKQWTWHGVPGVKVTVTLDGSASYDPDAGDSLQYSWSGKAVGNQPIVFLQLSAGSYVAFLTAQDQYYASTVNAVKFSVRDLADPGPPSDCGGQIALRDPKSVIAYRYQGDPPPFWSVIRSYASSEGLGVQVNFHTRGQVLRMAEPLSRLHLGEVIYRQAVSANLGAVVRQARIPTGINAGRSPRGPGQ